MTDHPLLFTAPMVRAILAGAKTQTRRVVDMKHLKAFLPKDVRSDPPIDARVTAKRGLRRITIGKSGAVHCIEPHMGLKPGEFHLACPYADGETHLADLGGGRKVWTIVAQSSALWGRETWRACTAVDALRPADIMPGRHIRYEADGAWSGTVDLGDGDTCPCGETPGRLRVALHMPRWASRISLRVTQVRLERVQDISEEDAIAEGVAHADQYTTLSSPARNFQTLWREIHSDDSWLRNPWVWAIHFERIA